MPGFHASLWYGLWAPKDTPKDIVARLNAAMLEALAHEETRKRFADLGIDSAAARAADAGGVARVPEDRSRQVVADHQGRQHQGAVTIGAGESK